MEKVVYLLWGRPDAVAGDALRDRLLGDVAPRVLDARGARPHGERPRRRGGRGAQPGAALPTTRPPTWRRCRCGWTATTAAGSSTSSWPTPAFPPAPTSWPSRSTTTTARPPTPAPRTWPDGERSPGVLTVACIHRPAGPRLPRVDRALARHAVTGVGPAPAPHPLRAQRGGAGDQRRRPRGPRHRGGGLAVRRARGRPDAVLQRRRRSAALPRQHRRDDGQRGRAAWTWPASAAPRCRETFVRSL